ncbi:MAG: helix-turn-helix transcriptional regulator [Elusimicrobia bacterium]|nr:helix-turn-helix transcriptional regulator [Elusimicrobiota bacterium]MDE2510859.1 helix-turn-helix transcriptional regulator [Elusimicrobiota bacterium]
MNDDLLFCAFSDPIRRRVVRLLSRRTLCVCDLTGALGVPQPTVSRHLAALQRAGVVRVEKRGRWRHYGLAEAGNPVAEHLLKSAAAEPDRDGDRKRLAALPARDCA